LEKDKKRGGSRWEWWWTATGEDHGLTPFSWRRKATRATWRVSFPGEGVSGRKKGRWAGGEKKGEEKRERLRWARVRGVGVFI
jgi:hypothetical protein